jgi:hypothetical protein
MTLYRAKSEPHKLFKTSKPHFKESRRPEFSKYINDKVILLSNNADYALAFGIFQHTEDSRWSISYNRENGKHVISLGDPDWRSKVDLDAVIYLHEVEVENPIQMEYISKEDLIVKSTKTYRARDVLKKFIIYEPILVKDL